ncbi:helix-hairpin-helix domain-containing protein [uncultured Arthrobacter sp.]|uniref:helix-hairpin-helix domain-containing protein n=1 Tax=uncultured Arthrobacter sp. TaxID=114050 RepID=UPI0032174E61
MPRHEPGLPSSTEPGHAGRRLSAAIGSGNGAGLLAGPTIVTPREDQWEPGADDSPAQSRIRWRTGRRAAALLCLVSAVFLGWFWWQAANGTSEVSPLGSVTAAEAGDGPAAEPETEPGPATDEPPGGSAGDSRGNIIVHVAGAVVRAGIVELPRGSRLHQAIAAAGGSVPGADPDQLNLAAVLEDGQKILVPRQGEPVAAGPSPAAGSGAPGSPMGGADGTAPAAGKINLNTAGVDELGTLPRVGPVLAQRIVEWRAQHGRFQRVEELDAVDGVGPKLLASLLPLVRV